MTIKLRSELSCILIKATICNGKEIDLCLPVISVTFSFYFQKHLPITRIPFLEKLFPELGIRLGITILFILPITTLNCVPWPSIIALKWYNCVLWTALWMTLWTTDLYRSIVYIFWKQIENRYRNRRIANPRYQWPQKWIYFHPIFFNLITGLLLQD